MPDVTIVYWRDIPAQVIVGKGRRGAKAALPERFEQAIDRCAMRVGARDGDAYLAEWRKGPPCPADGDPGEIAAREAARLDAEYDAAALRALVDNGGLSPHRSAPPQPAPSDTPPARHPPLSAETGSDT